MALQLVDRLLTVDALADALAEITDLLTPAELAQLTDETALVVATARAYRFQPPTPPPGAA